MDQTATLLNQLFHLANRYNGKLVITANDRARVVSIVTRNGERTDSYDFSYVNWEEGILYAAIELAGSLGREKP